MLLRNAMRAAGPLGRQMRGFSKNLTPTATRGLSATTLRPLGTSAFAFSPLSESPVADSKIPEEPTPVAPDAPKDPKNPASHLHQKAPAVASHQRSGRPEAGSPVWTQRDNPAEFGRCIQSPYASLLPRNLIENHLEALDRKVRESPVAGLRAIETAVADGLQMGPREDFLKMVALYSLKRGAEADAIFEKLMEYKNQMSPSLLCRITLAKVAALGYERRSEEAWRMMSELIEDPEAVLDVNRCSDALSANVMVWGDRGLSVVNAIFKHGYKPTQICFNNAIRCLRWDNSYKNLSSAVRLLNEMKYVEVQPNFETYGLMMDFSAANKQFPLAFEIIRQLRENEKVFLTSWGLQSLVLAITDCAEEAFRRERGLPPLRKEPRKPAVVETVEPKEGEEEKEQEQPEAEYLPSTAEALENVKELATVFKDLGIASTSPLIHSLVLTANRIGDSEDVISAYKEFVVPNFKLMEDMDVQVASRVTFLIALQAAAALGDHKLAAEIFEECKKSGRVNLAVVERVLASCSALPPTEAQALVDEAQKAEAEAAKEATDASASGSSPNTEDGASPDSPGFNLAAKRLQEKAEKSFPVVKDVMKSMIDLRIDASPNPSVFSTMINFGILTSDSEYLKDALTYAKCSGVDVSRNQFGAMISRLNEEDRGVLAELHETLEKKGTSPSEWLAETTPEVEASNRAQLGRNQRRTSPYFMGNSDLYARKKVPYLPRVPPSGKLN